MHETREKALWTTALRIFNIVWHISNFLMGKISFHRLNIQTNFTYV